MIRHIISIFLFFIFSTIMFSQSNSIDSLKTLLMHETDDTASMVLFTKISRSYRINSPDSSLFYANKMLKYAKDKEMYYYVSDAFDLMANVYEQEGELAKSAAAADSAKHYAKLINDPVGIIFFTNNKAAIFIKMGRYFDALQSFEEVKKIGERINRPSSVAAALNNMGVVYHYLGDDKTSLDYFIKAYQLRFKNNITKKLAFSLNNIGAIYAKYENYGEAIEYHKKAMKAAIEHKDDYNYLVSLINLGLDYHFLKDYNRSLEYYQQALNEAQKQGDKTLQSHALERMSAVYSDMGNTKKAKPLLQEALKLAKKNNNKYDITSFSNSLGNIYLKEKNYSAAIPLFNKALALAKTINADKLEVDVYKSLTAYYYSVNNPAKAFDYQKIFDAKRDSLFKAETDLKIANLKNRFELNLRMDELKQKDKELSFAKKTNDEQLIIIYITGIAAAVVLLLAVYILILYRKIKKKNLIIDKRNQQVNQLLEKEKELGKLKSQVISTVSHEFRTPMAIISSNAQMLGDFDETMGGDLKKETLGHIRNSIENMTAMMNNFELLDKKTILEFNPKPLNLRMHLKNLINGLQSLPTYKNRILINDKLTTEIIIADKSLITHIVRNLLINALKFSNPKPVDFLFGNTKNEVYLIFKDKGIGIPESEVNNIFENFYRASNSDNIKGTGVGMSVVKRCVDLHRGRIEINSEIGKGTVISVYLSVEYTDLK